MGTSLINRDRLVQTFIDLAQISSPSFSEDRVFDYLSETLRRLGLTVTLQEYGQGKNLIAVFPATKPSLPPLILAAHADTVAPCTDIRVETDGVTIRSDGKTVLGGDDKAAIAEIIETLCVVIEKDLPHGIIEVLVTSGEEVGLVGAKNLDRSLLSAQHCLVLDASGEVGTIVIGAPHQVCFEIDVHGKKAHAGIEPEKGVNAIVAAAGIIQRFPVGRLDPLSVANYGWISGGGASNIVPDQVTLRGEIRSHDDGQLASHIARLKEAAASALEVGATAKVTITREYNAFSVSETDPLVAMVRAACTQTGLPSSCVIGGGGSDANVLSEQGLSCLNLACGMRKIHTTDEYVLIDDLVQTAALLTRIVSDTVSLLQKPLPPS